MNQCLKISFHVDKPQSVLEALIRKRATELGIEGMVQAVDQRSVNIVACSTRENLENFLDLLHREAVVGALQNIAVEPLLKNKDYRGVFRIID